MKQTVYQHDFRNAFTGSQYENNFSREGLNALYDYLINLETGDDNEMELDIVSIACEYTEYESFEELQKSYTDIGSIEELEDNTTVIKLDNGGLIIADF